MRLRLYVNSAVLLAVCAAATVGTAMAEVKTYKLQLKDIEQLPNVKTSGIEGSVGRDPHQFAVEGLSILQPISVAIRSLDPGNPIDLTIHKLTWDEAERALTTDDETGVAVARFRTQGEFQIRLKAHENVAPYQMLVMVGDEVPPLMTPAVVTVEEFERWSDPTDSDGGSWWKVSLGLLIAGLILLAFRIYRHRAGIGNDV